MVEGLGLSRVAEAVQHEPCRLLGDANVLGEMSASDAIIAAGDKPDDENPFAETDLAILKDCADFDRKPLTAITAFVGSTIRKVVNLGRTAMRTNRAVLPADRSEILDSSLFIRQRLPHLDEAVDVVLLRSAAFHAPYMPRKSDWVNQVYRCHHWGTATFSAAAGALADPTPL